MEIEKLFKDLIVAYSDENLNKISSKLIDLYKSRNYSKIKEIANRIEKYVSIDNSKDAKFFSKLIMLYHPDKGDQQRKTIKEFYRQKKYEKLEKFSHILLIKDIDSIKVIEPEERIDYNPDYVWDAKSKDGYSYKDSDGEFYNEDEFDTPDFERSFYNMIKIREYGDIEREFPSYYLEDFEEFEMAYSGLDTLEGVEYCIHVKILDVSNNEISDLENLRELINLEELYLSNNQVGYIDDLSNLLNLKFLDISGNQIDDISPLFDLDYLEYLNLIGNPVPKAQIEKLKEKNVVVMF